MRQKIQKRSRFSSIQLMIKKTLKIVPKLSCQLDRNNVLMELGIYMNKTSFLSMLPHVVSLGLPTAPSAHWKARSSSKSGYIRNSFEQVSTWPCYHWQKYATAAALGASKLPSFLHIFLPSHSSCLASFRNALALTVTQAQLGDIISEVANSL